jgi:hypothetical protein
MHTLHSPWVYTASTQHVKLSEHIVNTGGLYSLYSHPSETGEAYYYYVHTHLGLNQDQEQ